MISVRIRRLHDSVALPAYQTDGAAGFDLAASEDVLVAPSSIALGLGAGAEARRPLGLAVVGGLMVSQTLTLYVTPVFYVYMEQMQDRLKRRKTAKAPVLAEATAK